jgi:addiction module RelE/StbE family toxin
LPNYIIQFSAEAKKDLTNIFNYIFYSLNEPNIAKKKIEKIKLAIYNLKTNPEIYPIIQEDILSKYDLRKIVIDNHIIFYTVLNNTIYIVRILYARKNWINLL